MTAGNDYSYPEVEKSVQLDYKSNVLEHQVAHVPIAGRRITTKMIEGLATEKYRSCGKGITFEDSQKRFSLRKTRVQRSLKHFHDCHVLFTAGDLISQGIHLIQNTNPQQYFPTCIKSDIVEDLKKRSRNVQVEPTVSNLSNLSNCGDAVSNAFEYHKAQSLLDILAKLQFTELYIHRLQLTLSIDKEYYQALARKAALINRAKRFEDIIGRRHVTFIFSPNGRVEISIRSSDTPFKIETEDDEAILFSFFGQVRDRLIYCISDVRERAVPQITNWILKGCDLNRDFEIDENAQLYLPDIQLKHAGQVFRMYIKSLHDKAICRVEKSLTPDLTLIRVLDSIISPVKAINDLTNVVLKIEQKIDSLSKQ